MAAVLRLSGDASAGPPNLLGFAKDLPAAEMRAPLLYSFKVGDDTVRELAVKRSVAVRDALLARGAPNSQIFLASAKTIHAGVPRAELTLSAR